MPSSVNTGCGAIEIGDQHVAGAGLAGHALALEPDLLALGDAGRNLDVDVLAGRQPQALGDALGRFRQRDRQGGVHVGADAEIFLLEMSIRRRARPRPAAPKASLRMSSKPPKLPLAAAARAATAAPRRPGEALRAEIEAFEIHVGAEAGARARPAATAAKALEARLAFGIDLAAIERLALVLVVEELMRGIQLGKARRRLGIVLVGVGMQLLGEPPIGALDVARARLAIDAQDFIGITHPRRTPNKLFGPAPPAQVPSMWA